MRTATLASRFLQLLLFLCALGIAVVVSAAGMLNAHLLDWTMLPLGMLCLMPVLIILDIAAAMAACMGRNRAPEEERQQDTDKRTDVLLRLATLMLLHLVTAGLAVFLLAVPAGSIWASGLTLVRFRGVFLALGSLSLLVSLQLPYVLTSMLLPLLRAKPEAKEGAKEGAKEDAGGTRADS